MLEVRLLDDNTFGVKIKNAESKNELVKCLKGLQEISIKKYVPTKSEYELPISSFYEIINSNRLKGQIIETSIDFELKITESAKRLNFLDKIRSLGLPAFTLNCLKLSMFPFQQNGALFAYFGNRVIIADSVGLGKSVQGLVAGAMASDVDNIIIACPANLRKKWYREIDKFTNYTRHMVQGTPKSREEYYDKSDDIKVYVISYSMLRTDVDKIHAAFFKRKLLIIGDEIQYVKNKDAKRTRALYSIIKTDDRFIGLSATYIETGLQDLFGVFLVVDDGVFGKSLPAFEKRYLKIDWLGKVCGYKRLDEIRRKIRPYVIRRRKEEVLKDLPRKVPIDYWTDMSPAEMKIYKDVEVGVFSDIADMQRANKVSAANLLTLTNYLIQAALHPLLVGSHGTSSKLRDLIGVIEGIDDSKVVVFCHFTKMVEMIDEELNKNKIKSLYIHGGTKDDPVDIINKFANEDYKVLVTSDKLREGHDILCSDTLVNFDLLWNPQKLAQRVGRIDRIGQKSKSITVINMMVNGTIEEDMYERVVERLKLFTDVVDDGNESKRDQTLKLGRDELMGILQKRRKR